jgi:hypothetical protein
VNNRDIYGLLITFTFLECAKNVTRTRRLAAGWVPCSGLNGPLLVVS